MLSDEFLIFNFFCFTEASSEGVPTLAKNERAVVLISAWQSSRLPHPQIVTFESFLTNYNNNGGRGGLDLDSGIFTCGTPGYYTVSYSANAVVGRDTEPSGQVMFLYKNNQLLRESNFYFATFHEAIDDSIRVTGSRIVVMKYSKKS